MTDAQVVRARRGQGGRSGALVALALIAVMAAALLLLADGSSRRTLNRSALGFEGLERWLESRDVPVRTVVGRNGPPEDVPTALRILPVQDAEPGERSRCGRGEERLACETLRDISRSALRRKADALDTLMVLPKWRRGVIELGATHPKLLIDPDKARAVAALVIDEPGTLVRTGEAMGRIAHEGREIVLPRPQLMTAGGCDVIVGTPQAMLLGFCPAGDYGVWLLSDPDLLHNFGLALGDNAEAAAALLPGLTGYDGEVVIDLSRYLWSSRSFGNRGGKPPSRDWSDMARLFEWPLSLVWMAFGFLSALVLWRAWRRWGAADARTDEEGGPLGSREVSIDAKARILRMAGDDASLLRTRFEGRLEATGDELLGPGPNGTARLMRVLRRRDAALAEELQGVVDDAARTVTVDSLMRLSDRFETLMGRVRDELGGAGRAR